MDTSYNYPQLFDDSTFDTDLFGGLNLTDNYLDTNNKKQQDYAAVNNQNSYLQYLQNNNNHNEFYYDTASQQMLLLPQAPTMNLADYDYFDTSPVATSDGKQYNWLYDPIDTNFLPTQQNLFHDGSLDQLDSIMADTMDDITTVQGGMSRGYVSLSDVNSFVAKADSKHSLQVPNDFTRRTDFSSSESTTNEDSEDDYSDSENELRWSSFDTSQKQKLMIKIKKPTPATYGAEPWLISPKSKSAMNRNKYRKSMSNIFLHSHSNGGGGGGGGGKKNKMDGKRRGSAPHRLTNPSLHSSSSLSSLSSTLQRSMRVSDSMHFLSKHSSDEEDEEEEDEDDDEYQIRSANAPHHIPTKKGRNVDKACNHCKRSHLRCDDMRPCRRCVATGKTGCKDVQHKPRGRPKLHKK